MLGFSYIVCEQNCLLFSIYQLHLSIHHSFLDLWMKSSHEKFVSKCQVRYILLGAITYPIPAGTFWFLSPLAGTGHFVPWRVSFILGKTWWKMSEPSLHRLGSLWAFGFFSLFRRSLEGTNKQVIARKYLFKKAMFLCFWIVLSESVDIISEPLVRNC